MKKTAIQWLMDRLPHSIETQFSKQIEHALEMERQQIIDAHISGYKYNGGKPIIKAENYYTQTFTEAKND